MLGLMGIFYRIHSPALYNDIRKLNESEISKPEVVYAAYDGASTNCFIAAGLYVIVFLFSLWQWRVNNSRRAYTIQ